VDYGDESAVLSALQTAANADEQEQAPAAPAPVAPVGETAPVQPPAQPETPAAPVDTTPDLFEGTPVNPDTLPAELQPLVKQLQAAYTQKTQSLAEERRQFDALGSPEEVQQAIDLYTRISDPTNWPQLHSDLSDLMVQYGLSPAEAAAEATAIVEEQAAAVELPGDADDPELAPLYKALQQQQSQLEALKAERQGELTARQEQEKAERLQMAIEGEINRQQNAILQSNPQYGDGDMDAIFELSSYYGGNLLDAQKRYEGLRAEWVGRYVEQKSTAATAQGAHPAPAAAPLAERPEGPQTVQEAADEIEEYMRRLQGAGELDFS
jgi:hypothetical protein